MSSTFKRMKFKGKTDARAREMVCVHLPRGSGPRDRDGCGTFSVDELKACKKTYSESSIEPGRRVQKNIYDMREQRRNLQSYRLHFDQVAMEPLRKLQKEAMQKEMSSSLFGGGLGMGMGKSALAGDDAEAAPPPPPPPEPAGTGTRSLQSIAAEIQMDDEHVNKIFKDYTSLADKKSELLNKKGFVRLVTEVAKKRTMADHDLEEWWNTTRSRPFMSDPSQDVKNRKNMCNFEQFMIWFGSSELRTQPYAWVYT